MCEGYTDVIGFADAGLPRAVATCGTALTEDHFRTLKSFAHRVVLAFDADAAGQNAAARFYEWERAYEIDVAVAALPAGVDPADLARSDPEALAAAVAEATPFLGFRLDRVLDQANLATPEGRARAAEAAVAGHRRAPQPAGARPVPDAGGVALSGARSSSSGREPWPRPRVPATTGRAGSRDGELRRVAPRSACRGPRRRPRRRGDATRPRSRRCACWSPTPTSSPGGSTSASSPTRSTSRPTEPCSAARQPARGGGRPPTRPRPTCCSAWPWRTPRPTRPTWWPGWSRKRRCASTP